MSNVCCKEFTGWVKSFTKVERALTVLEALLLIVLIVLLILLILHLVVCSRPYPPPTPGKNETFDSNKTDEIPNNKVDKVSGNYTTTHPGPKCSWTPSAKTTAAVHYYEDGRTRTQNRNEQIKYTPTRIPVPPYRFNDTDYTTDMIQSDFNSTITNLEPDLNGSIISLDTPEPDLNGTIVNLDTFEPDLNATVSPLEELESLIREEQSDGEVAKDYERFVTALVKLRPPKDVTFGCIVTMVTDRWVVTAASCIEAIEETDTLDSFVFMNNYGTGERGDISSVEDVQIHPMYEGRNKSFDLAMLQSSKVLLKGDPVEFASPLDFALLTLTQKFVTLGYGAFRSVGDDRRLRSANVYLVPGRRCARSGAALRHLAGGRALPAPPCASTDVCAGVLFSRGLPCNYCAGAPLLLTTKDSRNARLLGILAESEQCGVACEPALYVNVIDLQPWIQTVTA